MRSAISFKSQGDIVIIQGRDSSQKSLKKNAYSEPVLRVYGNIEDLTRTTTQVGGNSDTRGPNMDSRTH